MSRWELSTQEWEAVDRRRFVTTEAALFRNVTIMLMSAAGRTKTSIPRDLGCSPATVDNIRFRYQQHGREGLRQRKSPGRPSRPTAEYRAVLRQTGITFSNDQLERLLHQEGFSVQRPKPTLKGKRDEAAYEQAC